MSRLAQNPTGWTPAVDLLETAEHYTVLVELPGLRRDDIQIQLRDGRLTISGVRREREAPLEQVHRIERGHGQFSRTFQLPVPVDAERITADLRDGVLVVKCPKATDGPMRRIHIS